MLQFVLSSLGRSSLFSTSKVDLSFGFLKDHVARVAGVPYEQFSLKTTSGYIYNDEQLSTIVSRAYSAPICLELHLGLDGGKGGFGSLLRGGQGLNHKKTTNFNSCRDLNGRRIRIVDAERRLNEAAAQTDKKEEKDDEEEEEYDEKEEQKEKERELKVAQEVKYDQQKKEILDNVTKAMEIGLQNSKKRKAAEMEKKKQEEKETMKRMWGDMDLSSDEESEGDQENSPASDEKLTASGQDEGSSNNNEDSNSEERANKRQKISDNQFVPIHSNTNTPAAQIETAESEAQTTSASVEVKSEEREFDLNKYESAEQLESLGLEVLKVELQRRGLLCGGTLKDRAARLFSVRGKTRAQIDPKLFAKGANGNGNAGGRKKK
jgi:hypothetical protein